MTQEEIQALLEQGRQLSDALGPRVKRMQGPVSDAEVIAKLVEKEAGMGDGVRFVNIGIGLQSGWTIATARINGIGPLASVKFTRGVHGEDIGIDTSKRIWLQTPPCDVPKEVIADVVELICSAARANMVSALVGEGTSHKTRVRRYFGYEPDSYVSRRNQVQFDELAAEFAAVERETVEAIAVWLESAAMDDGDWHPLDAAGVLRRGDWRKT